VFVNPPYGRDLPQWIGKAAFEVRQGRAGSGGALIPARTDTRWWHDHIAGRAHVVLLRGRLQFGEGGQSAPFPSALAVWGAGDRTLERLREVFPEAWHIPPSPRDRTAQVIPLRQAGRD
jgi:hypothetical protein